MTLSSTTSKVVYIGDGSTAAFLTVFDFLANADVAVTLTDANDNETTWVEGTEYTLSGAGSGSGGTVTVKTTPVDYTPGANTMLTIRRAPEATQNTELPPGGNLSTAVLEKTFDRNIMVAQRVLEELDRSPKLPAAESGAADLPAATARADKYLAFDSNGDPIASSGPLGDSNVPISGLMQNLLNDATTGDAQDTLGGTAVGKSVFIAATTDVALDAVKGVKQGKHTIWIPAAAMRPTVSAGCVALTDIQTTAGNPDLQVGTSNYLANFVAL